MQTASSIDYAYLRQLVFGLSQNVLDPSRDYLFDTRLTKILRNQGMTQLEELVHRLKMKKDPVLERAIAEAMTINETSFFRDGRPFELLRTELLPKIIESRRYLRSFRIWSAACSTGQEIYSIAMLLKELLGDPDRYGVRLMGTDISNDAVARASRGLYNATEIARGLSEPLRDRYFARTRDGWQIRDEIRGMASFKHQNLMGDLSPLGKFDVIFCRNVAIYFSEADKISLFRRIERALEPNGYLVIGAMESLNGICPQFESQRHLRAVYYQVKTNPGRL